MKLDEQLLVILNKYKEEHLNSPWMGRKDLYDRLVTIFPDLGQDELNKKLYVLQHKKWLEYEFTEGGAGLVKIILEGIDVVEDIEKAVSSQNSFEEISQSEDNLAYIVDYGDILDQIKTVFQSQDKHIIILRGKSTTGKTSILKKISNQFGSNYSPLKLTLKAGALQSLTDFIQDFIGQLRIANFNTARNPIFPNPSQYSHISSSKDFFNQFYPDFRGELEAEKSPLIMIDEFDCLLDNLKLTGIEDILTFLWDLIANVHYGYFILVNSVDKKLSNNFFSRVNEQAHLIRINYYDEPTCQRFFNQLKTKIIFEDKTLTTCFSLCGGHRRLIEYLFRAINEIARPSLSHSQKPVITKGDMQQIIEKTIHYSFEDLEMMSGWLSEYEVAVINWMAGQLDDEETYIEMTYSLCSLVNFIFRSYQKFGILDEIWDRFMNWRWIERTHPYTGDIHFRLGLLLWWYRLSYNYRSR